MITFTPNRRRIIVSVVPILAALGSAIVLAPAAAAQLVYYEPHTGYSELVDPLHPGRFAESKSPHHVLRATTRAGDITWNVAFADVTNNSNFGFDDPVFGAARQATVLAVLDYVTTVLNESPATPIDITWDASLDAPGSGTLASMGTIYFFGVGFESGIAQEHITTGVDPLGGTTDISGQVNFGQTWNSETDNPVSGEFDLFSVVLHELTHGLGFASLVNPADGTSEIDGTNPGKFSLVDKFMAKDLVDPIGTGSATNLFSAGAQFTGSLSDLISNRLVFLGPSAVAVFGSNPQLYAPGPFEPGSSLSHWDFTTGDSVMVPAIFDGVKIREYLDFEIAALVDLGYPNAAVPAVVVDPVQTAIDLRTGFFSFDTNGDGSLSDAEAIAAGAPSADIDAIDDDANNALSRAELLDISVGPVGVAATVFADFTAVDVGSGTSIDPFNSLAEAVVFVAASGSVQIAAGSSSETFTSAQQISKALTLTTSSLTPVSIGN